MNLVVVYNPKSGNSLPVAVLREKFISRGIEIDELIAISDHAERKLRPHIKAKATIAVIGGDGTLSSMANILAGTQAIFAPLPGGTLNHFTKDLGIPQDLDQAINALKSTMPQKVDVGMVNGVAFINNSSIGLYPSSLRERDRIEDSLGKWPAIVVASVRTLVRMPGYRVKIDNETLRTPFVFIGNNEYSINTLGAPERTKLDRGILTIFVARTVSRRKLLQIAILSIVGRAHLLDEFEVRRAKSVTIATAHRRPSVSRDGEVGRMKSPLHYTVKRGALHVLY